MGRLKGFASNGAVPGQLLLSCTALASGVVLGGLLIASPANADACTADNVNDTPTATQCTGGQSTTTLTYVGSNTAPYGGGVFSLQLNNHDVNAAAGDGITFSGVAAGNDGTIILFSGSTIISGPGGNGITSSATGATTAIDVNGTSSVTGANGGIVATSNGGNITIDTEATTPIIGNAGAGISADAVAAGDVDVEALGTVTGSSDGIFAHAGANTVKVTTGAGAVTGGTGDGIHASAFGTVTVDTHGNVTGTGVINVGGGFGIFADSTNNGDVKVTTAANTTVEGKTDNGIHAQSATGRADVIAASTVIGGGHGIWASSGTGDVSVDTRANVTGTGNTGISASSFNGGNIEVKTAVDTTVIGSGGNGIDIEALDTGNIVVTANSAVTGSTGGIFADAISGTVKITTGTADVTGTGGDGIEATATGAVSGVTVAAGGNVTGTGGAGIFAQGENGLVDIDTAAGFTVSGTSGAGIYAEATTSGNVDVNAQSIVNGATKGIDANASGGPVKVVTGTADVTGNAGNGIEATAVGAVTVEAGGNVTGTGGTGIFASSAGGNVDVTTAAGTTVRGTNGQGINASTLIVNGSVTVTNSATAEGSLAGINASSSISGAIQITNNNIVRNLTGNDFNLAIRTTFGATTIDNNSQATITGRVETGAGIDTLNNGNFWYTEGASDFGLGNDAVNNNFSIVAGHNIGVADTTSFVNLENLNNNHSIILSDQDPVDGSNISDTLSTNGNYAGGVGSELAVDAFLGGAGSLADRFIVGGDTTGVTSIVVKDTNAGTGALNLTGILVVDVNSAGTADATNFVLAGGPIDKGLFVYDLVFDDANNDFLLVGLPGQEAFQALAVVASNQEIWRETADAWSTRQENLRDVLASSFGVTAVADPPVEGSTAPMSSLWVSALGSWTERDDDASFSLLDANLDFDVSYKQHIYGVVGGADFRAEMEGGGSVLFGAMAGYIDSQLDFDDSSTSIDTNGATIGAYAALLSDGFFATVLVKVDVLDMEFSTSEEDGKDSAGVTTIGARGDFGYRFGDAFFLEPMISLDAMSTDIEEFTIAGTEIDAGENESFRAGAGLRLGYGGEAIRASATARVWDVFATDNEVDIISGGVPLGLSDDDLEGVYGDLSGQIDVSLTSSTTLYLKGGVLFSDDVTKPNASGGFAFYW